MKIFRHRNLMGCIYSILIAIPFLSILATTCYVAMNKNAYQSYSGTQQVYEKVESNAPTNQVSQFSDLIEYNYYYLDIYSSDLSTDYGLVLHQTSDSKLNIINNAGIDIDDLSLENTVYFPNQILECYDDHFLIYFQDNSGENFITILQEGDYHIYGTYIYESFNENAYNSNLVFEETEYLLVNYVQTETSTLDNAFDYSLSKFVSDNDFGKLNLFEWFWSIFLTNNSQNMLYIHFVNWYMNYALLVSSAYILFLVLMWFINFSRRILERGMNYDW